MLLWKNKTNKMNLKRKERDKLSYQVMNLIVTANIGKIDLENLAKSLPLSEHLTFLEHSPFVSGSHHFGRIVKGNVDKSNAKSYVFRNNMSLVFCKRKLKIFRNGTVHVPGLKDYEEAYRLCELLVNEINQLPSYDIKLISFNISSMSILFEIRKRSEEEFKNIALNLHQREQNVVLTSSKQMFVYCYDELREKSNVLGTYRCKCGVKKCDCLMLKLCYSRNGKIKCTCITHPSQLEKLQEYVCSYLIAI